MVDGQPPIRIGDAGLYPRWFLDIAKHITRDKIFIISKYVVNNPLATDILISQSVDLDVLCKLLQRYYVDVRLRSYYSLMGDKCIWIGILLSLQDTSPYSSVIRVENYYRIDEFQAIYNHMVESILSSLLPRIKSYLQERIAADPLTHPVCHLPQLKNIDLDLQQDIIDRLKEKGLFAYMGVATHDGETRALICVRPEEGLSTCDKCCYSCNIL